MYKWQRKIFFIWNTTFRLIKTKFNNYNLGMNIEWQTEKTPKKGKNVGIREKLDQFINWYNNKDLLRKSI